MILNNFIYGVDIGNIVCCVNIFVKKLVLNFLSEYCWVCMFVVCDFVDNGICCYFWFVFVNYFWFDGVCFVEMVKNFVYIVVRYF